MGTSIDSAPAARRPWQRRLVWALAAVAVYAIAGFLIVPILARGRIEKLLSETLHRQAAVASVRFNPFTLTGRLEGVELRERDGTPLLRLSRLTVNMQLSGLFRRAWRFREIVLEEPRAVVRILEDGTLSIADLFAAEEEKAPPDPDRPFPRVIVDRFTLRAGALNFVDRSREPTFTQDFAPIDLSVEDLSTLPDESGGHTLSLGFGREARLRWTGRQTVEPLHLEGRFEITRIPLPHVGNYVLAGNPLELRGGTLDVACGYDIARAPEGAIAVSLREGSLTATDLAVGPRGETEDWLVVPRAEVRDLRASWSESRLEIGAVRVVAPRAFAWLEDGAVNWQEAFAAPQPAAVETHAVDAKPAGRTRPWSARIADLVIADGSARVEDRSIEPGVVVNVSAAQIHLQDLSTEAAAVVRASLSARINDAAQLTAGGTVTPAPLAGEMTLALRSLDLVPFKTYAAALPGADLRRGVADLEGRLVVGEGSPRVRFDGEATVKGLEVAGAGVERLAACERMEIAGARLTLAPDRLRIGNTAIRGAFLDFEIDRAGNLNLMDVFAGAPQPASGAAVFPVEISRVTLQDASLQFADRSLILPFSTAIRAAGGTLRDLSTTSAASARLELEGRVAEAGFVKVDGTMRIADPFAASDVGVIFRGIPMIDLSPYTAQFAGYAVKSGSLDINLRYMLQGRRLVGDHRLVADDMVVGEKVEGGDAGLPIRLAVALLKDKNGRIDLEVPIEGTIDAPEFAYRKILWQAVRKILANVAAAPFRALGRLFGADEEDLELVGFVAGRSDLPVPELEKLSKVAAEVARRPDLLIAIEGRFDPIADTAALRRIGLERKIDARRTGDAGLESILEGLYAEALTPERLEAERAKFASAAAPAASFDAGAFYDALRAGLLEAEPVSERDLAQLAAAREAAVAAVLTAPGGSDASRVTQREPGPVKRRKQGSELVASEMILSAKD